MTKNEVVFLYGGDKLTPPEFTEMLNEMPTEVAIVTFDKVAYDVMQSVTIAVANEEGNTKELLEQCEGAWNALIAEPLDSILGREDFDIERAKLRNDDMILLASNMTLPNEEIKEERTNCKYCGCPNPLEKGKCTYCGTKLETKEIRSVYDLDYEPTKEELEQAKENLIKVVEELSEKPLAEEIMIMELTKEMGEETVRNIGEERIRKMTQLVFKMKESPEDFVYCKECGFPVYTPKGDTCTICNYNPHWKSDEELSQEINHDFNDLFEDIAYGVAHELKGVITKEELLKKTKERTGKFYGHDKITWGKEKVLLETCKTVLKRGNRGSVCYHCGYPLRAWDRACFACGKQVPKNTDEITINKPKEKKLSRKEREVLKKIKEKEEITTEDLRAMQPIEPLSEPGRVFDPYVPKETVVVKVKVRDCPKCACDVEVGEEKCSKCGQEFHKDGSAKFEGVPNDNEIVTNPIINFIEEDDKIQDIIMHGTGEELEGLPYAWDVLSEDEVRKQVFAELNEQFESEEIEENKELVLEYIENQVDTYRKMNIADIDAAIEEDEQREINDRLRRNK